jgi:hypothetical protein
MPLKFRWGSHLATYGIMVPQGLKLIKILISELDHRQREQKNMNRATFTGDLPSVHPAREVGLLRRLRVGECGIKLGVDFTVVLLLRPSYLTSSSL